MSNHNNPGRASREYKREVLIERQSEMAGANAAARNEPYDTNPHRGGPYLQGFTCEMRAAAWSKGHNGMRAKMLHDKELGIT